jgi:hypothetical protein
MARLTVGQKTRRMLVFLMGLGNREIARALQGYGFDQAIMDEGWTLLRQTAAMQLDGPPSRQLTREEVERLDGWENRWFPIAGAVLRRHHPEEHTTVFHNLRQTHGNEVVLSVGTLLARLDALPGGQASPVRATLARHGLTEQVLEEARGMLGGVTQSPPAEPPGAEDDEPVVDPAAEAAMWSYYLQWSAIARSAISDRRLLRRLGFLRKQRAGEEEAPGDETPVDGIPVDEPPPAAGAATTRK